MESLTQTLGESRTEAPAADVQGSVNRNACHGLHPHRPQR